MSADLLPAPCQNAGIREREREGERDREDAEKTGQERGREKGERISAHPLSCGAQPETALMGSELD